MRRLMSLLVAFTFLASMAGCCGGGNGGCGGGGGCGVGGGHTLSQGMCDCQIDDHCLERAPWLRFGAAAPVGEPIQVPPTKMPDARKL